MWSVQTIGIVKALANAPVWHRAMVKAVVTMAVGVLVEAVAPDLNVLPVVIVRHNAHPPAAIKNVAPMVVGVSVVVARQMGIVQLTAPALVYPNVARIGSVGRMVAVVIAILVQPQRPSVTRVSIFV